MLSSLPMVKSGKIRALAVTGDKRSPLLPDVPTMREAGLKNFEFYSWYGLWAPAKLPEPILKKLEVATQKVMTSASMKEQLDNLGFESSYRNSADFARYIQAETDKYSAIIKQANITAE